MKTSHMALGAFLKTTNDLFYRRTFRTSLYKAKINNDKINV